MASAQELDKALAELKRITGIALDVKARTPEEVELALTQIHCLSLAYKEKYNKNHFLQTLMTDGIPSYDVFERAARLHIDAEAPRALFLVETKGPVDETIM